MTGYEDPCGWFEKASNFQDRFSGESAVKPVGITGGMMTAKARVQTHRAKLGTDQCGRLEAWVSTDLIEALRTIARQQNRSAVGTLVERTTLFTVLSRMDDCEECLRRHVRYTSMSRVCARKD